MAIGRGVSDNAYLRISPIAITSTANQPYAAVLIAPVGVTVPTGTSAVVSSLHVVEPVITATGTVTTAATVYIANAPTEGGSANHALMVAAGSTSLAGSLTVTGGGSLTGTWSDLGTVTTIDINGGSIDGVTIGTNAVATEIRVGNFNLNGNALYSTNTDGHINLIPNGTGDVQLNTETVRVGDENADATITSWGTGGIRLNTNAGTNSGHIHINSGADGNILLVPDGTGDILLRADTVQIGDLNATANLTTRGTGDLVLDTNAGTESGNIVIEQGTDQPILIAPHGSGSVVITADTLDVSGKAMNIAIIDNSATSLTIKEGSNSYLTFNTANSGGEKITLGKPFDAGAVNVSGSSFTITGGSVDGITLGTNTAVLQAVIDDIDLNGKVITMTGDTGDTAVFTVGTSGTLSIVTTDDAGTDATIQITADGTAELAGRTVTLDASLDIVLSADGGNVTMDDGTNTIFDFDVDGTILTIHDDQNTADKAVITIAQHGALSIVTTDADAALANIQITADGTAELAGTVVTLDSAGDIELEATDDINIPANVGLTFGNDAEKIEGNGTDLTISGNNINLTAVEDLIIPANVGITFGDAGEKIEGDGTDLTISGNIINLSGAVTATGILKTDDATDATSTLDGSLQTDGGLSVAKDAIFGNDIKLLTDSAVLVFGAGSDATLTHTNDTGLTLNSTNKLMFNDASQFVQGISATVLGLGATDEIDLTAATVDINTTGIVYIDSAGISIDSSAASNFTTSSGALTITSAAAATWTVGGGNLLLDVTGDLVLSADGGNVTMDDGTATIFDFDVDGTTLTIHDDQDVSDTVVMTVAQNGAFSIVSTDAGAAAANRCFQHSFYRCWGCCG